MSSKQEYSYVVMVAGVQVYQCKDDRDTDVVLDIIKTGLSHVLDDESLDVEIHINVAIMVFRRQGL